jgi:L-ascorbate metabolism protein UlaG (beta-lactamase superfamily)
MRFLPLSLLERPSCVAAMLALFPLAGSTQEPPRFGALTAVSSDEAEIELIATAGSFVRLERSNDLVAWSAHRTLLATGTNRLTESTLARAGARFFRAAVVTGDDILTGDHVPTAQGDAVIHPINHASFVFRWNGVMAYNDPVGGAEPYAGLPRADLILVSHQHGDHFNAGTLQAVAGPEAVIIAPAAVAGSLPTSLRERTIALPNGTSTNVLGITVEAVPAYNANHARGVGNGYVVTLGGRRFYMSGDTGAIPETRALTDIDVAFLSMNVPFTMSVAEAASVTRDFRPRVLYPYHYRNQNGTFADLQALKEQVGPDAGVEIRERDWY